MALPTRTSTRARKPTTAALAFKTPITPSGIVKQRAGSSPQKVVAARMVDKWTQTRKCIGCKSELVSHLFLALHPKTAHDYKEKCFKCRRIDAVGDFLKTHAKNSNGTAALTVALQKDHIENQKEVCKKWKRTMNNRGFEIGDDVLTGVMKDINNHPALRKAAVAMINKRVRSNTTPSRFAAILTDNAHQPHTPPTSPERSTNTLTIHPSSPDSDDTTTNDTTSKKISSNLRLKATAAALHRAANALDIAHQLSPAHFDHITMSVFRRIFEADTISAWANMLTESVELAVATRGVWQTMEDQDLQAVRILAGMRSDGK